MTQRNGVVGPSQEWVGFIMEMDLGEYKIGSLTQTRRLPMLGWVIFFLLLALLAAIFGFGGIAGAAAGIAQFLFIVFLVFFIVALLFGRRVRV